MMLRSAAVVAGLALALISGEEKASYIFDFTQTSAGVLETGKGSISLDGLTFADDNTIGSFVVPQFASTTVGSGAIRVYHAIFISSTPFGTSFYTAASSSAGDAVGFAPNFRDYTLYVPIDYVSGDDLGISQAFYKSATLDSLGLRLGSYTYRTQPNHGSVVFTVNIGLSAAPIPSSAPMFGTALLGLAGVGYAAKRKAKTTA